ncbi:protocatechuate 3,4-dioxygenase subunit beta [uncultured Methylibium sp.]|uniref:dioxygenase family protein n=1 Tax=uncultured Methylibium sp. TaxID=381093 RepID=UPI0025E817B5|nr:protocatechuate 3,4-dioxygenase subunit beta [uncultured Methylibium sp.]
MDFQPLPAGTDADLLHPAYRSTARRGPRQPPLRVRLPAATEAGLALPPSLLLPRDADLTARGASAPLGEKIAVVGRVVDEDGRPVRDSLIEVWQCNAAGRYWHAKDQHDAPLDPNFFGFGKCFTDGDGRFRFVTIKPGPYPWGNHDKAWRPAHIHFSLFGNVLAQRLVTQMYFAGDPLLALDPIVQSIPDATARTRLDAHLDMDATVGAEMLGWRFDIVLRGRGATPFGL